MAKFTSNHSNMNDFIDNPEPIDHESDRIVSLSKDEFYSVYAVTATGRVFYRRAKGQTGTNYDPWREVDVISEIQRDLTGDTED